MTNLIILGMLIVIMEFAVEAIKAQLSVIPVWEKIKGFVIPLITLLTMTAIILGTDVLLFSALEIPCLPVVDYVTTILICSLGTTAWHEFRKKIKEAKDFEKDFDKEDK